MLKKILIALLIFSVLFTAISYSKLATGIKRKIDVVIPDKITEVFTEPNYIAKPPKYIINDSLHYYNQKKSFISLKNSLKSKYNKTSSSKDKDKVLKDASILLYSNLSDSLIPYWYGTPWDYNGISQKPGSGNIACGYFVFTLLRDAGFKLPRIKMSQSASEQAIKSIVPNSQIKRFSNVSITDFVSKMKAWGKGFYIIGLDNHVGLYQVTEDESWFIHSTVIFPSCVIKEKALVSPALDYTNYRVVGKLSDYNALTKKWLFSESISLK